MLNHYGRHIRKRKESKNKTYVTAYSENSVQGCNVPLALLVRKARVSMGL